MPRWWDLVLQTSTSPGAMGKSRSAEHEINGGLIWDIHGDIHDINDIKIQKPLRMVDINDIINGIFMILMISWGLIWDINDTNDIINYKKTIKNGGAK